MLANYDDEGYNKNMAQLVISKGEREAQAAAYQVLLLKAKRAREAEEQS